MKYNFTKLIKARLERRMTQAEMAKETGLSRMTISRVESGRGPWLKAIRKMERVLEVKVIEKNGSQGTNRSR